MSRPIDIAKRIPYKTARKQGMCKAKAYIKAGGSPKTAYHDIAGNKLVQTCERELQEEFKAQDITPEKILRRINIDRQLAFVQKDISSMIRADELLGKYLSMFTDKLQISGGLTFTKDEMTEYQALRELYGRKKSIAASRLHDVKPVDIIPLVKSDISISDDKQLTASALPIIEPAMPDANPISPTINR